MCNNIEQYVNEFEKSLKLKKNYKNIKLPLNIAVTNLVDVKLNLSSIQIEKNKKLTAINIKFI